MLANPKTITELSGTEAYLKAAQTFSRLTDRVLETEGWTLADAGGLNFKTPMIEASDYYRENVIWTEMYIPISKQYQPGRPS